MDEQRFAERLNKCMEELRQRNKMKAEMRVLDSILGLKLMRPFIACMLLDFAERVAALKRGPKKGEITPQIEALIEEAYPEVHDYYLALRASGFADCIVNGEDKTIEKWKKATERHFNRLPEASHKWVPVEYLQDDDLYKGDRGQIAKNVEAKLLQKIIKAKYNDKISIEDIHRIKMKSKIGSGKDQP